MKTLVTAEDVQKEFDKAVRMVTRMNGTRPPNANNQWWKWTVMAEQRLRYLEKQRVAVLEQQVHDLTEQLEDQLELLKHRLAKVKGDVTRLRRRE